MSVAVTCIGPDCPNFLTIPSGEGFELSRRIAKRINEEIEQLREKVSMTLGRPLDDTLVSLREIYKECSANNWDGYGSAAITYNAYEEAAKVIKLLPSSIQMPEITAEPTGGIGLEWYRGKNRVFVISVSGKHIISYAGIFNGNKLHGSEYFEETLPLVIIQHLRRLYL